MPSLPNNLTTRMIEIVFDGEIGTFNITMYVYVTSLCICISTIKFHVQYCIIVYVGAFVE
jgi:hypothetical protein